MSLLTSVESISAGGAHSVAVKTDGSVWAWGLNGAGELGIGTQNSQTIPVQVPGLTAASLVKPSACGGYHTLLIKPDLTLAAWGSGVYGQLGDGTFGYANTLAEPAGIVLVAWDDRNLDGIPDSWESNYNLSFSDPATGDQDADSDGLSNWQEYMAGTNPTSVDTDGDGLQDSIDPAPLVADQWAPVFSIPGGVYNSAQNVVVATTITGATIHYTTNGQNPTINDPVVANSGTVSVTQSLTLKAAAFATGGSSSVTSGTYYLFTDTRTIWVNGAVSGTGAGTFANPYKTISQAVTASSTSALIVVRSGTYNEQVNITKSGTTGAPYTLQGAPGERVIISGMKPITGWTLSSGSTYVTTSGTRRLESFYVDKQQRLMAQAPNVGTGRWAYQSRVVDSSSNTVITDTVHLVGIGDLSGGYIQSFESDNLTICGRQILSNDPVAGTLTFDGNVPNNGSDTSYIIKNRLQLLDQPGEWACIKSGSTYSVYYWPNDVSELSKTQTRGDYYPSVVQLNNLHDAVVKGFEVMGCTYGDAGIKASNCTNASIQGNVLHDNGAYIWNGSGIRVTGLKGAGAYLSNCVNCTISNNFITMNTNGISVDSSTNCTVTKNEISYNFIDGMDVSGMNNTAPCIGLTLSNNYIHHQLNLTQHADAFQTYDKGVQQMHVLNNLIMCQDQVMHNGFQGDYHGNVIWNTKINALGNNNGIGDIVVANNTFRNANGLGIGSGSTGMLTTMTENVFYGRTTVPYPRIYTGNRNLITPITSDNVAFVITPSWRTFTTAAAFYAYTGQDQNSLVADAQVVNMPTTKRIVGNLPLCTRNTLALYNDSTPDLGDFAVGNHIEFNMDGVVRTITAVDTVNKTITFDVPLAGVAPFPRNDMVENWGSRTNYARDSRLSSGSPGLTMSGTGGPVGSLINISQYQAGDFDGDGVRDIPVLPSDVPSSVDFHISNWFSFGNN